MMEVKRKNEKSPNDLLPEATLLTNFSFLFGSCFVWFSDCLHWSSGESSVITESNLKKKCWKGREDGELVLVQVSHRCNRIIGRLSKQNTPDIKERGEQF